jgi:hypothetical protein
MGPNIYHKSNKNNNNHKILNKIDLLSKARIEYTWVKLDHKFYGCLGNQVLEMGYSGPLYMEGPNGCQPKSSRFLRIGLLGIVKIGPRALH